MSPAAPPLLQFPLSLSLVDRSTALTAVRVNRGTVLPSGPLVILTQDTKLTVVDRTTTVTVLPLSRSASPVRMVYPTSLGLIDRPSTLTPIAVGRTLSVIDRPTTVTLILASVVLTGGSDSFDRADGPLGPNWTGGSEGALTIASNQVVGAAGFNNRSVMRATETYGNDHYSQIEAIGALPVGAWIGPGVRMQNSGQDGYVVIYNNDTSGPHGGYALSLYKRVGGTFTQIDPNSGIGAAGYTLDGPLSAGDKVRLSVAGSQLTVWLNGVRVTKQTDTSIASGGLPGILSFDAGVADNWSGGQATAEPAAPYQTFTSSPPNSANNGGGHTIKVLSPTAPAAGVPHNFLYVLPVDSDGVTTFGDGIDHLYGLNAHNKYNLTIIEPNFGIGPWYVNHPTDPTLKHETYMVSDLAPWVTANYSSSGTEQHWLLGFSRSGFGAITLLTRHPTVFTKAACWDGAVDLSSSNYVSYGANVAMDGPTADAYALTSAHLDTYKAPFQLSPRIWLGGYQAFQTATAAFDTLLTSKGMFHTNGPSVARAHEWHSGWVPGALAALAAMPPLIGPGVVRPVAATKTAAQVAITVPTIFSQLVLTPVATDNFNRSNGAIGGANNWLSYASTPSPLGGSTVINSNEVRAVPSTISGNYRSETYSSDQYSTVKVGSVQLAVGDFIGPVVRQQDSLNGYLAIYFSSGGPVRREMDIYKMVAGVLTQLSRWGVADGPGFGDPLGAGVPLTLVAEGNVLTLLIGGQPFGSITDNTFTGGAPGVVAFNANGATVGTLDNWEGGNAHTGSLSAASATDNFNRANNGLSVSQANWTAMTSYPAVDIPIVSNELKVVSGTHAADMRSDAFNADHWSAIKVGSTFVDTSGFVGVLTRMQGTQKSGYLGCLFGPFNVQYTIWRVDNAVSTLLAVVQSGDSSDGLGGVSNGFVRNPTGTEFKLVSQGNRHSLRVNGSEVLAATDATYTTGKPGVMLYPTSYADNWSGGNV